MFYPRTQAGKGGPGLEIGRYPGTWPGWERCRKVLEKGREVTLEGGSKEEYSVQGTSTVDGFNIPHGEELDRSSCWEPLPGWLPESGSERTLGSLQKVRGSEKGEEGREEGRERKRRGEGKREPEM